MIESRNFSISIVGVVGAHSSVHASFMLRKGLTRLQLPKGYLGLRIVECRNSSDTLKLGLGALQIGNITLFSPNHFKVRIGYPPGTYSWQP